MGYEGMVDAPRWYAISTKIRQEDRAESNLRAWGVETFTPRIKERWRNPFTGEPGFITKALFPRYLFARFSVYELLHKVNFTRGVVGVVSCNGLPTPVDDEIIALIMSRRGDDGFIRIGEELHPGDKVVIEDGPLKNLAGIFEQRLKGEGRVSVLLTAINYQGRVLIDEESLRRVV